jgi:hypothetical protein
METQENEIKSIHNIEKFVEEYKLKGSNYRFDLKARVKMKTDSGNFTKETKVQIVLGESYDNGRLYLFGNDIDPFLYPTEFKARYQNFEFVEESLLKITGYHAINNKIGNYSVIVIPINVCEKSI